MLLFGSEALRRQIVERRVRDAGGRIISVRSVSSVVRTSSSTANP